MKNNPIGILDSGVGGFTILQAIQQELPSESVITIADSGNAPYGDKSPEYITKRALELTRLLIEQKAKLIILACNTITVTALERIRADFPDTPIVGVVPVIKTAAALTKNKRIGVLSTTTTAQSRYQKHLIEEFANGCEVFNFGTDQLVPLIEKGELSGEHLETILKPILHRFQKENIDALALGCTHYPLLREQLHRMLGPGIELLDSGGAIARQTRRVLEHNSLLADAEPIYQVLTSGDTTIAKKILATTIEDKLHERITIATLEK